MKHLKTKLPLSILLILIPVLNLYAADSSTRFIEIPSSPNPVGSGARALGMGGAFIAVADDATAASWNPAGLIALDKPEISIVGNAFHRIEDNSFGVCPESNGIQTVSLTDLNYFSLSYPLSIKGYKTVFSLNYQHLYDFSRKWNFTLAFPDETLLIDYQSEGSLSAIGFACAARIAENLSIGLTCNIWDDDLTHNFREQTTRQWNTGMDGKNRFVEKIQNDDTFSFKGYNFNIGILWENINGSGLTIGAVLKTPFKADLNHSNSFYSYTQFPDLASRYDVLHTTELTEDADLDMPMSYGIGFSYRFSDNFMTSLDIYRTQWDEFVLTDSGGSEKCPITGKQKYASDIDPTHQVRTGMEYIGLHTSRYIFPVTFGLFYDPAPAEGSPDDIYGISIGAGMTDRKRFTFDFAYQYRFGNDVSGSILKEWEFSQDIREHTVYISGIIYF